MCSARREANLRSRESALEKTDEEYSEKREALQKLPALRKQVETLEAENRDLRNQVEPRAHKFTVLKKQRNKRQATASLSNHY
jgi:predicted RNase H-like nuclease (RuvC/YqgF family)